MAFADDYYGGLIRRILGAGRKTGARNGATRRLVAQQVTFTDFPLVQARATAWKTALREWQWFMSGSERIDDLHPSAHPWWRPWANAEGRVPHNYGAQLRRWVGSDGKPFDQIQYVIDGLRAHAGSRRLVTTTWNASDMASPACPITNCHGTVTQVFCHDGDLHVVTYQRSVDVVCGLPHNWVQYWAFLLWLAARTGNRPEALTWIGGDVHIYEAHADLARRVAVASVGLPEAPGLFFNGGTPSAEEFRADDFVLSRPYQPVITEKAELIV